MLLGATFTALLLCGVYAVVPPPTDVTVSCQNLKTTVSWKYSSQDPETRFRVTVDGSEGYFKTNTTEHQCDLSQFVWGSATQYLGLHCVYVAALQGGDESETAVKCFSFNHLKTVDLKCLLDFPPVDLSVNQDVASLTFPNPMRFYKELEQADGQDGASVEFVVSTANGTFESSCSVGHVTCRLDVPLPEGGEPCVTLGGRLCSRECVRYVTFNKTGRICPSAHSDGKMDRYVISFAVALSVLALVIVAVTVCICKEKVWKMSPYQKPPGFLDLKKQPQWFIRVHPDVYSPVTVTARIPSGLSEDDHCLMKTPEDDDRSGSSSSLGFQSCEKLYEDNHLLEDSNQELDPGGHGPDQASTDECDSMDLEEEEEIAVSPYDRPQHLQDMGDGDMVISYTGS